MEKLRHCGVCIDPKNETPKKETKISSLGTITRKSYGYRNGINNCDKEYTILLVGVSKCGKSTIIDCIANFLMGIRLPKLDERYYVTRSSTDKKNHTVTKDFCFYTFYTCDTVYNFIDSPSITNDNGDIDEKHEEKLRTIIKENKNCEKGIQIHAVGLVIQNYFNQLPPAEESMLRFVTDLVGKDFISHIIPFITYTDIGIPPVLDALRKFDIDTEKHLKFNNLCLNPTTTKITNLEIAHWIMCLENVQKGINNVMKLGPICLLHNKNTCSPSTLPHLWSSSSSGTSGGGSSGVGSRSRKENTKTQTSTPVSVRPKSLIITIKERGNEELKNGKPKEAIDLYTQAIKLDPDNHILYSNRSVAYARMKNYSEALADGEKSLTINPDWIKGYSRKGNALAYLGRYREAVVTYEEGLVLDPNNQDLKNALTDCKATEHKFMGNEEPNSSNKHIQNASGPPSFLPQQQSISSSVTSGGGPTSLDSTSEESPASVRPKSSVHTKSEAMKPLPKDMSEIHAEIKQLGLSNPNAKVDTPRKKLISHIISSSSIKRSISQSSILLVGSSGTGKSSTINHIFNLHTNQLAKTSETESETRITREYIIESDYLSYNVKNLKLGVVDSPGFNDTAGLKQDVCNFYSIKEFYNSHPNLKGCYPNLIFVFVQATDTRICGLNSNLSKSLRCLSKLDLVDEKHPNVVGVLTWSCSISRKDWKSKIDNKKEILKDIIQQCLKISAPIIAIENDIEGNELQLVGDFSRLPDGELQPKNVYNACENVFAQSGDNLGLIIFNACFLNPKLPTLGYQITAKNASYYKLTDEESKYLKVLENH